MGFIVVIMVVQVIARYGFNSSLIWAEELCRYLLIWLTFLLVGVAFQRGEFIAVDIVAAALKPPARFVLKVAVTIPVLVFLFYVVANGYEFALRLGIQTIPALDFIWGSIVGGDATLDVSVFWIYLSVPLGCGLLAIHIAASLVLEGSALRAGKTAAEAMQR